jgi:hypothetical protein
MVRTTPESYMDDSEVKQQRHRTQIKLMSVGVMKD